MILVFLIINLETVLKKNGINKLKMNINWCMIIKKMTLAHNHTKNAALVDSLVDDLG
jgi:hypothetical protein